MVAPKIARKGSSFKGAGQYYLHDKKASTNERVVFTHTQNLATDDPETAIKMMAYTAMHQADLKARSGQVKTGRKVTATVYSYSLSWDTDQNPEQAEMIEAAKDTLEILGLQDHEALLVAHNDTKHPHIHVIVNRIHPETGLANTHSNDKLKLSKWAESYEKKEGKIRCPQRVVNNEKRRCGLFVKYRENKNYKAAQQSRKQQQKQAQEQREIAQNTKDSPDVREQKLALHKEKEARIAYRRQKMEEHTRPGWAALYRRQRKEQEKAQEKKQSVITRFKDWLKTQDKEQNFLTGAVKAILGHADLYRQLMARHREERAAFAEKHAARSKQIFEEENKHFQAELIQLDRLQPEKQRTSEPAQARKDEIDKPAEEDIGMQPSHTLSEEFKKRASATRKRRRRRDERSRDKDHGRERD